MKRIRRGKIVIPSYDDVYNYFIVENHSQKECANHYNMSTGKFSSVVQNYGIKKSNDLINAVTRRVKKEKYGCETYNNREQSAKTKELRYGDKNYVNAEKKRKTLYERYGSETFNNRGKCKETLLIRYGSSNYNNRDKYKNTCLDKYNVENVWSSKEVRDKCCDTKFAKYGDRNFTNRDKYRKTIKDKYGVENFVQTREYHKLARKRYVCNDVYFDSFPELAMWVYAKDHGEDIYRCNESLEYSYKGKKHYYFPDFIYKGQFVEVKGSQFFTQDGKMQNPFDHSQDGLYEAKHLCALKNDVKFVLYEEYCDYIKYFNSKYKLKDYRVEV